MRSLAPEYKSEYHQTYVQHLQWAVKSKGIKNIALTGRYGSGKSSILDEFAQREVDLGKNVVRISINTLGPDTDEDIANRIQKELVKQLIYRVKPGKLSSRYGRAMEPSAWRIAGESLCATIVVLGLLRLFGFWPSPHALWSLPEFVPGIAFALLLFVVVWAARWMIGTRMISEVAAAGTSIKLENREESARTYFDEYLHDIVTFFETDETDIVIFEDLDRFDNEQIFDSLRELNTLLNASEHVRRRSKPLRFVYAIKDSLFEKLGDEPETSDDVQSTVTDADQTRGPDDRLATVARTQTAKRARDAAQAEVERANRTKFFEIVIPVVPFLSHNNARDLLDAALQTLELPGDAKISRPLLDLVARHTTDMRLLINICNEFVVFAERLLWCDEPAPGMNADKLFALVVYKNFHLADFERIPQRNSALDELSVQRNAIVRHCVAEFQGRRHKVREWNDKWRQQERVAQMLGQRLLTAVAFPRGFQNFEINNEQVSKDDVRIVDFWQQVHRAERLGVVFRDASNRTTQHEVTRDQIEALFPEALDQERWREPSESDLEATRGEIDTEIAELRGADFAELASDENAVFKDNRTFGDVVEKTFTSRLAGDLVRQGFIDRYYAEYASPFYGKFIGVDVANFFRNCVWPNEMDIDFTFTSHDAVRNVMEQAPSDFTSSRSVLDASIIDHVLEQDPDAAQEVVRFIMAEPSDGRDRFLREYLSDEGSLATRLVARLAESGWRPLLGRLATLEVEERHRVLLMDAALMNLEDAERLDLDEGAGIRIRDLHRQLSTFTTDQSESRSAIIRDVIERIPFEIPQLAVLGTTLKQAIISNQHYSLTAENLRAALGIESAVGLEEVMKDDRVWSRCAGVFSVYLDVVAADDLTSYAVRTPQTLTEVVKHDCETWENEELTKLLELSAPEACLPNIEELPQHSWPAIVTARQMVASAANVYFYAQTHQIDAALAALLRDQLAKGTELSGVESLSPETAHDLAQHLLNAHSVLDVQQRIWLALQLYPDGASPELDASDFHPDAEDPLLLANLLEAGLVADTTTTFDHFLSVGGWPVIASAFEASEHASEILTPELVPDGEAVVDLLENPKVATSVKQKIMTNLGTYVPDAHDGALRVAARYANSNGIDLPADQLRRVAQIVRDSEQSLPLIARSKSLSTSEMFAMLPLLEDDYVGFGGGPGHEFEIPAPSPETERFLTRLKREGFIERPRSGRKGIRKIKNLM